MKSVLTLFMLMVFAMFISVDNAEAILSPDGESFLTSLEAEAVSLAPSAVVLEYAAVQEAEAEIVCVVTKWPHVELLSTGLDAQHPHDNCFATVEGRADRAHIRPGGASRFQ